MSHIPPTTQATRDYIDSIANDARKEAHNWAARSWSIDTAISAWRKMKPGEPSGTYALAIANAVEAYRLAQGDHCTDEQYNGIVWAFTREGDTLPDPRATRPPDYWQTRTDWADV